MDKYVVAAVPVITLLLSLASFFSARLRSYTLANQAFSLAKALGEQTEDGLDPATRRAAAALRQEAIIRGHRATTEFLDRTRPGRKRTLIEALGVTVNMTILAVGILGLRVPEQHVGDKIVAAVATFLVGILVGYLMDRSGRKQEAKDRELEAKGRQELMLAGRGVGS